MVEQLATLCSLSGKLTVSERLLLSCCPVNTRGKPTIHAAPTATKQGGVPTEKRMPWQLESAVQICSGPMTPIILDLKNEKTQSQNSQT
jgi:hypothetical protein